MADSILSATQRINGSWDFVLSLQYKPGVHGAITINVPAGFNTVTDARIALQNILPIRRQIWAKAVEARLNYQKV